MAFLKSMADSRLVPPTRQEAEDSCSQLGIPSYRAIPPFYSRETDRLADRQQKEMKLQQTVHSDEQLAAFEGARSALEQLQAAAMARTFGVVPRLGPYCGSASIGLDGLGSVIIVLFPGQNIKKIVGKRMLKSRKRIFCISVFK